MAFHWKTFQTRTLTAIIFAAVMLTGLLWNPWSFLILFSIIHFGCWWEYLKINETIHSNSLHKYFRDGFMFTGFALMLWFCSSVFEINDYRVSEFFPPVILVIGIIFLGAGLLKSGKINSGFAAAAALGIVYISLCWGLMIDLYREIEVDKHDTVFILSRTFLPVLIVASIWINDTMAYIIGSLIGKRPLSAISPKKTWEGTIGGMLLSVALVWFLFGQLFNNTPLQSFAAHSAIIAGIASISGTAGDLLESKLKRLAGLKDSGNLMPGHGGFLDRFDSMLLAVPAVWLYVFFFIG